MSNYNEIESLINDQFDQASEKEKETKPVEEPISQPQQPEEPVPPPQVPEEDISKAKDSIYTEKINKLKKVIHSKDEEIDDLKNHITELNQQRQMEKEAYNAQQAKETKTEKEDKKNIISDLSSKKKMAIIVVVVVFVLAVIVAVFIHKKHADIEPTETDSEHDSGGDE